MNPTIESVLILLTGGATTLGLKMCWDFLSRKPPKAHNGFLTMDDLTKHCEKQQSTCAKIIAADLKVMMIEISSRLAAGDKDFDTIGDRLTKIETGLSNVGLKVDSLANSKTRPEQRQPNVIAGR